MTCGNWLVSFLFLLVSLSVRAVDPPDEIIDAWKRLDRIIDHRLPVEAIAASEYPNVLKLLKLAEAAMETAPSNEEIETAWRKRGLKLQDLTNSNREMVRDELRASRFISQNRNMIDAILRSGLPFLYEKLIESLKLKQKPRACLVLLPLPCPSNAAYNKVEHFMYQACREAEKDGALIIIVNSPYGRKEYLPRAREWMAAENGERFAERFAKYVENGTTRIVDSLPGQSNTPWAFLFVNGTLKAEGTVGKWIDQPESLLDLLKAP
jgi:hypothetical protein